MTEDTKPMSISLANFKRPNTFRRRQKVDSAHGRV